MYGFHMLCKSTVVVGPKLALAALGWSFIQMNFNMSSDMLFVIEFFSTKRTRKILDAVGIMTPLKMPIHISRTQATIGTAREFTWEGMTHCGVRMVNRAVMILQTCRRGCAEIAFSSWTLKLDFDMHSSHMNPEITAVVRSEVTVIALEPLFI